MAVGFFCCCLFSVCVVCVDSVFLISFSFVISFSGFIGCEFYIKFAGILYCDKSIW